MSEKIATTADILRAEGAEALYVYGSRARDDYRPDSDLDVFVDIARGAQFSLFELAGIKIALEAATGLDVHVTTRQSLHPMLRETIERDAVRIF